MPSYSLTLRTSIIDGTPSPIGNISNIAKKWQRYTDWLGGYDIGTFNVYGTPAKLRSYFETWMRLDVIESVGGIDIWNGEIRKMDFMQGNMPLSIDFNECYNRVRCSYGTGGSYCAWGSNTDSQAKYGIREKTLQVSCDTEAGAIDERDRFLEQYAWPPLIPARDLRRMSDEIYLRVYVFGYKYSIGDLDCRNVSVNEGDTISAAVDATVDDAVYVTTRSVDTNSNTVIDDNDKENAWEYLSRLLVMTDSSGNLFRGWIDANRNFFYKIWNLTPAYYVRNGRVYTDAGARVEYNPRWLEPGIYRDLDSVLTGQNRGGLLQDRNDFLVERVFVDEHDNFGFMTADSVADFMMLVRALEQEAGDGGGTGGGGSKWKWGQMTDAQKKWWQGGRVGPAPNY